MREFCRRRSAVDAPTESYDKVYTSKSTGVSIDDFVDQIANRFAKETSHLKGERVVGVIVAYGGEVAWSDIFASGELFNHYWNKLLRSYVVEALARPSCGRSPRVTTAGDSCGV